MAMAMAPAGCRARAETNKTARTMTTIKMMKMTSIVALSRRENAAALATVWIGKQALSLPFPFGRMSHALSTWAPVLNEHAFVLVGPVDIEVINQAMDDDDDDDDGDGSSRLQDITPASDAPPRPVAYLRSEFTPIEPSRYDTVLRAGLRQGIDAHLKLSIDDELPPLHWDTGIRREARELVPEIVRLNRAWMRRCDGEIVLGKNDCRHYVDSLLGALGLVPLRGSDEDAAQAAGGGTWLSLREIDEARNPGICHPFLLHSTDGKVGLSRDTC